MQASRTLSRSGVAVATARPVLQFLAIMLIALVAGSTFGIWRGYDPGGYSALTFLETLQGAVGGLNVTLPLMGAGALVMTGILAVMARRDRPVAGAYAFAFVLMAVAAVITRFANQPINADVVTWTPDSMPANWTAIRDVWWHWHVVRTMLSMLALAVLVLATMADRNRSSAPSA